MRVTLSTLQKMYQEEDKITVLTCYDACFATLLENVGIDVLLVGDSLGNVIQGKDTTLSVTLENMIYHTHCVAHGSDRVFIMTDMPFGTFQLTPESTFKNAVKLVSAGAQMVKIEGGRIMADTIRFLTQRGIPVCAHIGLTPQSIHQLGGYKVQGTTKKESKQLLEDAIVLEQAGANMLLMELIPATLAKRITQQLTIPTIGIGAGASCSAQVLVLHDLLGVYPGKAKFKKDFMIESHSIQDAIKCYIDEVKTGKFPSPDHEF